MQVANLDAVRQIRLPGSFKELSMIGLFKLVEASNQTGEMRIVSRGRLVRIWVRRGKIINIRGPKTEIYLKFLLTHNGFMTESIYARLFKEFKKRQKRSGTFSEGAGQFLDYLMSLDMVRQLDRDNVHRVLTEWQMLDMFTWRTGRFSFDESRLPDRYYSLPGLFPKRTIWRFQQMLDAPTALSSNFDWEHKIDVHQGNLNQVPFVILLNQIKAERVSGNLKLEPELANKWFRGWRPYSLSIQNGYPQANSNRWLILLSGDLGSYAFKTNKRLSQEPLQEKKTHYFGAFFNEDKVQKHLARRLVDFKKSISGAESSVRATTNWKAWMGVQVEDSFEVVKPTLAWFIPIAIPLIALWAFLALHQSGEQRRTIAFDPEHLWAHHAGQVLKDISSRKLNLETNPNIKLKSDGFDILIQRVGQRISKDLDTDEIRTYQISIAPPAQNDAPSVIDFTVDDIANANDKAFLVGRKFSTR